MRTAHSVLIAAVMLASVPALAQQPKLEDRLTASEFRAAGLGKLSDAELERLNELLARDETGTASMTAAPAAVASTDVEARIAQAREAGRREAAADAASLPATTSREPIESTIPGAFNGFAQGRQYTLANGQVWRQIDGASISGARGQDIAVRVRPGFMGVWWMKVEGYNTQAKVERVR